MGSLLAAPAIVRASSLMPVRALATRPQIVFGYMLYPGELALGMSSVAWTDLFVAGDDVFNFHRGNLIVTHSAEGMTWETPARGDPS